MTRSGGTLHVGFKKVNWQVMHVCMSWSMWLQMTYQLHSAPFGSQVSDVIIRAKQWRKKALATKETEEDSKVQS